MTPGSNASVVPVPSSVAITGNPAAWASSKTRPKASARFQEERTNIEAAAKYARSHTSSTLPAKCTLAQRRAHCPTLELTTRDAVSHDDDRKLASGCGVDEIIEALVRHDAADRQCETITVALTKCGDPIVICVLRCPALDIDTVRDDSRLNAGGIDERRTIAHAFARHDHGVRTPKCSDDQRLVGKEERALPKDVRVIGRDQRGATSSNERTQLTDRLGMWRCTMAPRAARASQRGKVGVIGVDSTRPNSPTWISCPAIAEGGRFPLVLQRRAQTRTVCSMSGRANESSGCDARSRPTPAGTRLCRHGARASASLFILLASAGSTSFPLLSRLLSAAVVLWQRYRCQTIRYGDTTSLVRSEPLGVTFSNGSNGSRTAERAKQSG